MRILYFLFFMPTTLGFTVLPYIQIDYAHYFRLAQCKAKCAEKYGTASRKTLNDGSILEMIETASEDARACELGCMQHRRGHRKQPRSSKSQALHDGSRFWMESSADSANMGSCPVSAVELLCQNPHVSDDLEDSAEGFVGLRLHRSAGAARFVVQWKHRTYALGVYDESQWITASVEESNVFRVDGLIPSVQYKFMITVVGPNGRLGDTVVSEWAEIAAAGNPQKAPGGPLTARNGFNTEQGATAQLHWPRTSYDSCYYRLQVTNSSYQSTQDFTVDPSVSYLLPNLEFDSHYSVSLAALNVEGSQTSRSITTQFKSFECRRVYGRGSLHCAPEPVADLKVIVKPNGTATISWRSTVNHESILTYQLEVESVEEGCSRSGVNVYLNAAASKYDVPLAGGCEYVVRLVNYDLLGREATTETQVKVSSLLPAAMINWEIISIAVAVCVLLLLCSFIRCLCANRGRVAEKEAKLTDSYA